MATVLKSLEDTGASTGQAPHPEAAGVWLALENILSSQPFRTSKQCQDLLRYIVQHSLGGDETGLRERVVGVEVFGRQANYDTGEDPVVRMRAADVRKRLAQYYQSAEHDGALGSLIHIELKPGSYRASFRSETPAARPMPAEASVIAAAPIAAAEPVAVHADLAPVPLLQVERGAATRRRLRPAMLLGLLVLAAAAGLVWRLRETRAAGAQQRFWAPLTRSGRPVLIYLGSNATYILRPEVLERYQHEHSKEYTGPEFYPDLTKGGWIRTEDFLPQKNTFVTVGDLAASAQLISLMSLWQKPFILRSAEDVSMGELRGTPTVLIGGFNNRWTLETMGDLPFAFRDGRRIQSRSDPKRGWSMAPGSGGENTEDFALISRVLHADTGGPVLAIGGIGSYGTQAAAEFVTSEEEMNKLLKGAPPGWEGKNMQAVLRIKVVEYSPVATEVVATVYW